MDETEILAALTALDFDPARPCDWTTSDCEQPAHWAGKLSCCKHVTYRCEKHRASIDRLFAECVPIPHEECGGDARRIAWDVYGGTE